MTGVFITKADDRGLPPGHVRKSLWDACRALEGRLIRIRVDEFTPQRTLDQNAFLHAEPFPILAKHFGCSVEQVKYDLMGECFGWVPSKVTGREIPFMPSTSAMTVAQCTFFIDWLLAWAIQEHGVSIRTPDDWQRSEGAMR
jgi:hypothetical protein